MPGAGSQYSVMGRPQDPRSSMFGSSINLNGQFPSLYLLHQNNFLRGEGGWGSNNVEPAKEQHLEGCWHNITSVDSFNGPTQSTHTIQVLNIINNNCHGGTHQGILGIEWHPPRIPQSSFRHLSVLRINSSAEVSGINFLLKLFLALICPNSGNWRSVLSREACCTPQMRNYISAEII